MDKPTTTEFHSEWALSYDKPTQPFVSMVTWFADKYIRRYSRGLPNVTETIIDELIVDVVIKTLEKRNSYANSKFGDDPSKIVPYFNTVIKSYAFSTMY